MIILDGSSYVDTQGEWVICSWSSRWSNFTSVKLVEISIIASAKLLIYNCFYRCYVQMHSNAFNPLQGSLTVNESNGLQTATVLFESFCIDLFFSSNKSENKVLLVNNASDNVLK